MVNDDEDFAMTTGHGHRVLLTVGSSWARLTTVDPSVGVGAPLQSADDLPRIVADLSERLHARIIERRACRRRFAHQVALQHRISVRSVSRRLSLMHRGGLAE